MRFKLNGEAKEYQGDLNVKLLQYLREDLGLKSLKRACDGEGSCGACTVQVDGKALSSCSLSMASLEGKAVFTPEGIATRLREVFADAFLEHGGVQCGFCTPGIIMSTLALLQKNMNPSREEVMKAIRRNICRCTGYHKVVDAILAAAKAIQTDSAVVCREKGAGVGTSYHKYDSRRAVFGDLPFVDDMTLPGMLHGALKLSEHPRAKVLSIDISAAERVQGVHKIITAKNIPGERITGLIVKDWKVMIDEGEETQYIGNILAVVAASSEAIAREAAQKIKVTYEVLEPVTDIFFSMSENAPHLHPQGNILSKSAVKIGDATACLATSAFVSRGRYSTQRIEHAFMEPESALATPKGTTGITIYSQTQGAYEDRTALAKILGLAESEVQVIQVQTGGGFGGKEDLSVQPYAALLAQALKKPVKLTLSRTESLLIHPKRHPFIMDYEVGCDTKGMLTAIKAKLYCDTGAYASVGMKVMERAVGHATGAYSVPNVDVEGWAVYTNNIPCGAMRGFGVNQATFAFEGCIDDLCSQGGFDRWQFRYDNALADGKRTVTGQIIKQGAGVRATLLALKEDFYKAKYAGIACGIKNTGIGNGMADIGRCRIDIIAADKVVVHHGWTEMGQGIHTIALQVLCEETGIDPKVVEVKVDTTAEVVCGMTTASRGTSLVGNSIIEATRALKNDLQHSSLARLAGKTYHGEWICDFTTKIGTAKTPDAEITHYSYGYATQVVTLDDKGKIDTIYAAHDAGRIMNPVLFEGQIEGAIHMGLGYALTENFAMVAARPVSLKYNKLGIIRSTSMPKVVVKGVEISDPNGPYGAKGVGEIGLVPTAAAVAGAAYAWDRKRRYSLPIQDIELL